MDLKQPGIGIKMKMKIDTYLQNCTCIHILHDFENEGKLLDYATLTYRTATLVVDIEVTWHVNLRLNVELKSMYNTFAKCIC